MTGGPVLQKTMDSAHGELKIEVHCDRLHCNVGKWYLQAGPLAPRDNLRLGLSTVLSRLSFPTCHCECRRLRDFVDTEEPISKVLVCEYRTYYRHNVMRQSERELSDAKTSNDPANSLHAGDNPRGSHRRPAQVSKAVFAAGHHTRRGD